MILRFPYIKRKFVYMHIKKKDCYIVTLTELLIYPSGYVCGTNTSNKASKSHDRFSARKALISTGVVYLNVAISLMKELKVGLCRTV